MHFYYFFPFFVAGLLMATLLSNKLHVGIRHAVEKSGIQIIIYNENYDVLYVVFRIL